MINNPLVEKINKALLEARKQRLKEKMSGSITLMTETRVKTLTTLLGEFERKVIGEHRPDISDYRIKGLFKNYLNDVQKNYELTKDNTYKVEIQILNSLDIVQAMLNEQEIDLQIQKLYDRLRKDPNFISASNKRHIVEVNFFKEFVPTMVNPNIVRERLNRFFNTK